MHLRDYSNVRRRRYAQRHPEAQSLNGLDVLLHIDSFCLGDTICWASLLPAFIAQTKPKRLCVTTFWPELFENTEQLQFISAVSEEMHECDKFLSVGYNKNDLWHVTHGMALAARKTLQLPPETPASREMFKRKPFLRRADKIVIAPESIKRIARWDYLGNYGWQDVIDRLNRRGYEVHNISHEQHLLLRGVVPHHYNSDIWAAIMHICESRLFIGLSSGLAWLAWAYNTPVVMIAGFTKPFNEFPCFRVLNPFACSGCFNTITPMTGFCPILANTPREHECHKTITPDMVMQQVNAALM